MAAVFLMRRTQLARSRGCRRVLPGELAVLATLVVVAPLLAHADEGTPPIALRHAVPRGYECPSRRDFIAFVRGELSLASEPFSADGSLLADVHVVAHSGRLKGTIRFTGGSETDRSWGGEQSFSRGSGDCRDLSQTMALVVAMAIEQARRAPRLAASREPLAGSSPKYGRPWRLSVATGWNISQGLTPRVSVGFAAAVDLTKGWFSVGPEGTLTLPSTTDRHAGGDVRVARSELVLKVCATVPLRHRGADLGPPGLAGWLGAPVTAYGCLGGGIDIFRSAGTHVAESTVRTSTSPVAVGRGGLRLLRFGPIFFGAYGGFTVVAVPKTFQIDGKEAWEQAAIGALFGGSLSADVF